MIFFVAFFLMNPSITFGLFEAEVFPYAIIFGLFFIRKVYTPILFIIIYITFIGLISVMFNNRLPNDFIRSYSAYINPLIAVLLVYSNEKLRNFIIKYSKNYFYFLVILGLVQTFNLIPFLDDFFKFIVPRSSATALEDSGRGVTLLSTEPARAGIDFLFLYILVCFTNPISKYKIILDVFFLFYILFVFKSVTVLMITFIYFSIIYFSIKKILWYIGLIIVLLFLTLDVNNLSRSAILIRDLSILTNEEKYFLLINTSGNRLLSILTFYPYAAKTFIGGGIGNWAQSSMQALEYANINPKNYNFFKYDYNVGMRGSGYFTNLALDNGILGVVPVIFAILKIGKFYIVNNRKILAFFIVFLFNLFFVGSVGTTPIWVLFFSFLFKDNFSTK